MHRPTLVLFLAGLAIGSCTPDDRRGPANLTLCDDCATGGVAEAVTARAFSSFEASTFRPGGVYFYIDGTRADGRGFTLEIDAPTGAGPGASPRYRYAEFRNGAALFDSRTLALRGWIQIARSADDEAGAAAAWELEFTDGASARTVAGRANTGQIAPGNLSSQAPTTTPEYTDPYLDVWINVDVPVDTTTYDPAAPGSSVGGCEGDTTSGGSGGCQGDTTSGSSGGGCSGDTTSGSSGGGCSGDTTSGSGGSGCSGDSTGGSSSGGGCDGGGSVGTSSSGGGCGGGGGAGCGGDATPGARAHARIASARPSVQRAWLGMEPWFIALVGLPFLPRRKRAEPVSETAR